jgi:hypothetical protein
MTPEQRIARAHRAQSALDEFLTPMFAELRTAYSERIVEVANTELSRDKRADKITALSNALKVISVLEAGMAEVVRDGDLAKREKLKAEEIEKLSPAKRRLLSIAPQR